jgi:hypothetical protein
MQTNDSFSPEQSLQLIQSMIEKTKNNVKENGFYFLMWGWLVFIAALLNFILIRFTDFEQPYLAWCILIVGVVASIIKGVRDDKKEKAKTYLGEAMNYFGMTLGILYSGLAFVFGYYNLWEQSFPIYILLYGAGCFFMGSMLRFNLLKWSGLLCIPIMIGSVYVSYEWQLLFMALAVLVSYIIPGHILNAKPKSQN